MIEEELVEFRGGEDDWIYNELTIDGEEEEVDEYMREGREKREERRGKTITYVSSEFIKERINERIKASMWEARVTWVG